MSKSQICAAVADGERLARPGWVVVALPLPNDALAALVRPGVEIDLFGSDGAVVASQVRVLAACSAAAAVGLGVRIFA